MSVLYDAQFPINRPILACYSLWCLGQGLLSVVLLSACFEGIFPWADLQVKESCPQSSIA